MILVYVFIFIVTIIILVGLYLNICLFVEYFYHPTLWSTTNVYNIILFPFNALELVLCFSLISAAFVQSLVNSGNLIPICLGISAVEDVFYNICTWILSGSIFIRLIILLEGKYLTVDPVEPILTATGTLRLLNGVSMTKFGLITGMACACFSISECVGQILENTYFQKYGKPLYVTLCSAEGEPTFQPTLVYLSVIRQLLYLFWIESSSYRAHKFSAKSRGAIGKKRQNLLTFDEIVIIARVRHYSRLLRLGICLVLLMVGEFGYSNIVVLTFDFFATFIQTCIIPGILVIRSKKNYPEFWTTQNRRSPFPCRPRVEPEEFQLQEIENGLNVRTLVPRTAVMD
ncbi:uncharacterized protein LOC111708358 isoform X2 [Eurytemora carolleeae]|uniref:uncharacterized protein LOC111708358 isoform X2 n=1 Tax=Eurytemora carolleeae TaxID=1294199 RepID=UPI000C793A76|nr:uncharacterized protein LOC111708358 isoform X2 [Eurytemora carolleeae]|eukprot:XP_023337460.1 uncharacterized protein LOC111708358 isoform X2 [Eurytemora affinis]